MTVCTTVGEAVTGSFFPAAAAAVRISFCGGVGRAAAVPLEGEGDALTEAGSDPTTTVFCSFPEPSTDVDGCLALISLIVPVG